MSVRPKILALLRASYMQLHTAGLSQALLRQDTFLLATQQPFTLSAELEGARQHGLLEPGAEPRPVRPCAFKLHAMCAASASEVKGAS